MSDIFREVEEELRQERLKKLWQKFGPAVIGVAVLIVVATGGYRLWEWYSFRQAAQASDRFFAAVELARDEAHADAATAFGEVAEGGYGLAEFAELRAASALASAGDVPTAIAAYDAVAADGSVDRLIRDVARIRAGYLELDLTDVASVRARVDGLTAPDHPFRFMANEVLGVAHFKAGEKVEALRLFSAISQDPAAPSEIRDRAGAFEDLLVAEGVTFDAPNEAGQE